MHTTQASFDRVTTQHVYATRRDGYASTVLECTGCHGLRSHLIRVEWTSDRKSRMSNYGSHVNQAGISKHLETQLLVEG
jgi:hypothetical protein